MRKAVMLSVVGACALLAGCGQGGGEKAAQAPAAPAVPEPTDAEKQALLASLPAPYNTADVDNGQRVFARCRSCHTVTEGGPEL